MKKISSLLLVIVLGSSLTGCARSVSKFTYPSGQSLEGEMDE